MHACDSGGRAYSPTRVLGLDVANVGVWAVSGVEWNRCCIDSSLLASSSLATAFKGLRSTAEDIEFMSRLRVSQLQSH